MKQLFSEFKYKPMDVVKPKFTETYLLIVSLNRVRWRDRILLCYMVMEVVNDGHWTRIGEEKECYRGWVEDGNLVEKVGNIVPVKKTVYFCEN